MRARDPSRRPITSAYPGVDEHADPFFAPLDIAGYNYSPQQYAPDHKRLPGRVMVATESFPADSYDYWQVSSVVHRSAPPPCQLATALRPHARAHARSHPSPLPRLTLAGCVGARVGGGRLHLDSARLHRGVCHRQRRVHERC